MSLLSTFSQPVDVSGVTAEAWFPAIASLPEGRSVTSWTEDGNNGIFVQFFDALGVPEGQPIRITDADERANRPTLSVLENGSLIVAYTDLASITSAQISARLLSLTGDEIGSKQVLFSPNLGTSVAPSISPLPDGGFVVLHDNTPLDGSSFGVFAQVFDAEGSVRQPLFQVNQTTDSFQSGGRATALADGGFAVVWNSRNVDFSSDAVLVRTYDADGTPRTSETRVNLFASGRQTDPALTTLSDGRLIVVWESEGQDGSGDGVYGRFLSAAGSPQGDEFRINTRTTNDQKNATVAATPDGGFIVVWDNTFTTNSADIRFQRFDNSGARVGSEGIIGAGLANQNVAPILAVGEDGVARIAWINIERGADAFTIFTAFTGRTIDGDGRSNALSGTTANDVMTGLGGADTIDGGDGNDTISGGRGTDAVEGGLGNDDLSGNGGDDSLMGNDGNDTITGGIGGDTLDGGGGADDLSGDAGVDSLIGGADNDTLRGNGGNDTLIGDSGEDHLLGGNNNDTLLGGNNADTLEGGNQRDSLDGGEGADNLLGGRGNDTMIGGAGNDTLNGQRGNDELTGGLGADVFRFRANGGDDVITDLGTGADTLELDDALWTGTLTETEVVDMFGDVTGTGLRLRFDGGESVVLTGLFDEGTLASLIDIV